MFIVGYGKNKGRDKMVCNNCGKKVHSDFVYLHICNFDEHSKLKNVKKYGLKTLNEKELILLNLLKVSKNKDYKEGLRIDLKETRKEIKRIKGLK